MDQCVLEVFDLHPQNTGLRDAAIYPWKAPDKFASAPTLSIHCSRTVSNAASWFGSRKATGTLEPVPRLSAGNHTTTAAYPNWLSRPGPDACLP